MKAASLQSSLFIPANGLTLTPVWRENNPPRRQTASRSGYARRSLLISQERDARWVGVMEVISCCALVMSLVFALGVCLQQFAQF